MQTLRQLAQKNTEKFDKKIAGKQFLLGKYFDPTSKHICKTDKKFVKSKTGKLLQRQQKIAKQTKMLPKESSDELRLEHYIPLNRLWQQYIISLIGKQQIIYLFGIEKFNKPDFHGAYITIINSKTESYVGLSGIVIKETLKSFILAPDYSNQSLQITNKMKSQITIIKSVCIFMISVLDQYCFVINGNSLVYRPSDRIKHKFKFRKAQKMNLELMKTLQEVRNQQNKMQEE